MRIEFVNFCKPKCTPLSLFCLDQVAVLLTMQKLESVGELSECLEYLRHTFPDFGLQFGTIFGIISIFKKYRMGDEIEKVLQHANIPILDENQLTNAKYMDMFHRSRGQFYAEIEQLASLQVRKLGPWWTLN